MDLFDATALNLLLGPRARQATGACLMAGHRLVVDLDLLDQTELNEHDRDRLRLYTRDCRDWWANLDMWVDRGFGDAPGPYVMIARPLIDAVPRRKGGNSRAILWLRDELDALRNLNRFSEIIDEATGPGPDTKALKRIAEGNSLTIKRTGGKLVITGSFDGESGLRYLSWSPALGGGTLPGEIARSVTVTIGGPASADRAAQRIERVEVLASQLWPDPAPEMAAPPT